MAQASDVARPRLPAFMTETAVRKACLIEEGWNNRDLGSVALACTSDSRWRNRVVFPVGREQLVKSPKQTWARELNYRAIKERGRIASPFVLPMSGVTMPATGSGHTATRTGGSASRA